ncbi:MAG: aminotransferase class V-fold PLP-dependent enzyme [Coriobacteriia bacterium]|nr:aminotransferase class V-fold PLP-dependent enzyme [Coriobacteriia bacterium]
MSETASRPESVRYFDHAASSWPKPPEVVDAMVHAVRDLGGNPGRGAYDLSLQTSRAIFDARRSCAGLLGVPDSVDLAFVPSCTYGCNLMLKGLLSPGDRVVVGSMEHNAVARPLAVLSAAGVDVTVVPADSSGFVDPDDVERAVAAARTRAVVCLHASNVTGTIQAVGDMADIAHAHGALMFVDGAQAGGHLDVDLAALGADAYALSGHKGLLGPQGIGLLYLSHDVDPIPLVEGGTGGSGSAESEMPSVRPDRYEAGTVNTPGIVALGAAARFVAAHGREQRALETRLTQALIEGMASIPGIRVLGPPAGVERVPVVSIVHDTLDAERIAFQLDRTAHIACRPGLHCSPWAHRSAGTLETGAVRFGIGWGLDEGDVDYLLEQLARVVR